MLKCKSKDCTHSFKEESIHEIHIDLGKGVMLHSKLPVKDQDGNTLDFCESCTNTAFQEFVNGLSEVQKQYMRDQSQKQALDISKILL